MMLAMSVMELPSFGSVSGIASGDDEVSTMSHELSETMWLSEDCQRPCLPLGTLSTSSLGTSSISPMSPLSPPGRRRSRLDPGIYLTAQAAGHPGKILKLFDGEEDEASGIPTYVCKAYSAGEAKFYTELQARKDELLRFTPSYHGEEHANPVYEGGSPSRFLKFGNVLKRFGSTPHVMDCKLGVRSYGEDEAKSKKMRADLYKRMCDMDPSAPTEEEHLAGACTKYRYMSYNDEYTCLSTMGYRIEGIVSCATKTFIPKELLKRSRTRAAKADVIINHFLPRVWVQQDDDDWFEDAVLDEHSSRFIRLEACEKILCDLRELRRVMANSDFVKEREFVGSSLLFVVGSNSSAAAVYLIDFAKTGILPPGLSIDHVSPWKVGNHEDGILFGLDQVIDCWEEIMAILQAK